MEVAAGAIALGLTGDATKVSALSKTLSVERYTLSRQLAIGALPLPWFFTVQLDRKSVVSGQGADLGGRPIITEKEIVMRITSVLLVSSDPKSALVASTRRIKK